MLGTWKQEYRNSRGPWRPGTCGQKKQLCQRQKSGPSAGPVSPPCDELKQTIWSPQASSNTSKGSSRFKNFLVLWLLLFPESRGTFHSPQSSNHLGFLKMSSFFKARWISSWPTRAPHTSRFRLLSSHLIVFCFS